MAASLRTHLTNLISQQNRLIYAICVRGSRYDNKFLDNTRGFEELNKPLDEDDPRRFSKIKAATTDDVAFTDFDPRVKKFTNMIMMSGRKTSARENIILALERVKHHQVKQYHRTKDPEKKAAIQLDPFVIFHEVLDKGKPVMIIRPVVKAGSKLMVPVPCPEKRSEYLAMKWLVEAARAKPGAVKFYKSLSNQILQAYIGEGGLIKRKLDMHRLCEANKAYAYLA